MITKEDLLKEISLTELTELTDLNGDGELNEDVLNDSINDAISFISSFIEVPDTPTPLLINIACELTIWELRKKNSLTAPNKERLREIEGYLLKMANKKIPTSTTNYIDKKTSISGYSFRHRKKPLSFKGYR